ncbi:hypothetical protein VP01_504g3 [Puccinia sorghi]|uniref:HAT C-terminal dimerisation domain-containing protein n=1 Tax=Puccinia sorghi TaxID=27349 RepID=A0A0L6UNK0_9BASI|nr:hypothetical protein VP01_504g3 [Puccinia sorghi]
MCLLEPLSEATELLCGLKQLSKFFLQWYEPAPVNFNGIQAKIKCYLSEDVKLEGAKMLPYLSSCQTTFPKLALMACHYLSIPATSASSERVFSKGCPIFFSEVWFCKA